MSKEVLIVLLLLAVLLLVYIVIRHLRLKMQLKEMSTEIQKSQQLSYNKQITIDLLDKDLSELATNINHLLDYEKQLKFETQQKQNQLKQSISDIAHDLRTPITVVKGNLQLLAGRVQVGSKEQDQIQICMDKTEALQKMVDDFFELSLLESEEAKAELEKIDLTTFAAQFMITHEDVIRQHLLEPQIQLPERSLFVMANRDFLDRIFGNLLNNVFKYAKDTFLLRIEQTPDSRVMLSFENRLEKETNIDVRHLFDRTYRGDKARNGHSAGLGLYIVKLLAEKQNAQVHAEIRDNERLCISLIW